MTDQTHATDPYHDKQPRHQVPPALRADSQRLTPGRRVHLYELDMGVFGLGVERFCADSEETAPVKFRGYEFPPVAIQASGFEYSGQGSVPTPRLTVSLINTVFNALVNDYDDLIGARLTRLRTFAHFLDGGAQADPHAVLMPDIYYVERKVVSDGVTIEWELSPSVSYQSRMLPARQVFRDTCTHTYRRWDAQAGSFDNSKASCPYAGNKYFTYDGTPTSNPAEDRPSKQLTTCCKRRFGDDAVLPTRAFPGVARIKA
ncbi:MULTISPECIES: phage minor tail protein L [unclassified Azospirillum]|uniref:phage minor tail protein L n=1 Tax=unclassified Azospirillum TaxID=2630922 RepID=UPI000B6E62EC|nr:MULTISPECIES: phage minor tail protein L [unclassified Azospirillum]SNS83925.1 lambda-like phage minor tail protein L [Azospirillum sp. RU38E]SNT01165.1 lambda-like phage minor tail protein L [Azospirillum sp. RU37A]